MHCWWFLCFFLFLFAASAVRSGKVKDGPDDAKWVPEGGVAEKFDCGYSVEDCVVFDPEKDWKAEEGGEFEWPAFEEEDEGGRSEESDNYESGVLEERLFELCEAWTLWDGMGEVFIKLVSLLLVLVEEEGLEDDRGDDEQFAHESDECHD